MAAAGASTWASRPAEVVVAEQLHRKHVGKTAVWIYDYRDESVPVVARMLEKRSRAYRAIGYEIEEAAPPSTPAEYVIEYDEAPETTSAVRE